MLTAWADAIGVGDDKRLTLAKVIEVAKGHKDLHEAIQLVTSKKQGFDARSLELWLRDNGATSWVTAGSIAAPIPKAVPCGGSRDREGVWVVSRVCFQRDPLNLSD